MTFLWSRDQPGVDGPEFPEQGLTFIEYAQQVIPGLTDEEADWVLWNRTPFPLVMGRDDLHPYLVAERDRRAGGDFTGGFCEDCLRPNDEEHWPDCPMKERT